MRIGHGYDVHRFAKGRKLMLCGVEVDYELGLLGHSDADAALHALADSILGALALGDIGKLFPDSDPRYKDADSALLLAEVMRLAGEKGYELGNCDITIVAQEPKLAPYIESMRRRIAEICGCRHRRCQRQGHHRGRARLHRDPGGNCGPCGLPAPKTGNFSGKTVTPDALPA